MRLCPAQCTLDIPRAHGRVSLSVMAKAKRDGPGLRGPAFPGRIRLRVQSSRVSAPMRSNRSFDTDAQMRARLRRSWLCAGQLQR
jgi:hypothetical protein